MRYLFCFLQCSAVVKAACLEIRRYGFEPTLAFKFQRYKMFLPISILKIQYCGEPPCPRDSVLGLRRSGLEFRILCLEGRVTCHWSDTPLVRHTIGPTHHWSDTPLVRHTIGPTHHWSDWSDTPLVRHTIGPTIHDMPINLS